MPKLNTKMATKTAGFLNNNFGPGQLAMDTGTLFNLLRSSPMFAQMMGQNFMGANAARAGTAQALGRAGASTSGIGALSSGVSQSMGSRGAVDILGQLFGQSFGAAQTNLSGRMNAAPAYGQAFKESTGWEKFGGALKALAPMVVPGLGLAKMGLKGLGNVFGGGGPQIPEWDVNQALDTSQLGPRDYDYTPAIGSRRR